MPTPVTHLALAERMLREGTLPVAARRFLSQQRGPFLLGHTAPDVQTISGQSREETHFYTLPPAPDEPGEEHGPAHEKLLGAHPALADPASLPPERAAFVAGYIAHILVDDLWLYDIFLPYFRQGHAPWRERSFRHNVLRTWLDRGDHARLNGTVASSLRQAAPRGWLSFIQDEALQARRDWLVDQLGPGKQLQTAEVFAERMGRSALEIETVLRSPSQMEEHVFGHIPRATVRRYRDVAYSRSTQLIGSYVGRLMSR